MGREGVMVQKVEKVQMAKEGKEGKEGTESRGGTESIDGYRRWRWCG